MADLTRQEATEFIDQVREDNGGITPSERAWMQQHKPRILASFDSVRRKLGASTEILAKNLYNSEARFIYELIQNAEDNRYTKARAQGNEPWLRFTLGETSLLVESNEDGFTQANVKAICSVGQSTKSHTQGYIGEKGIGFKAVFIAANKVHIQSEPFSFAFDYDPDSDNSGLGMVTPINVPVETMAHDTRTQIELFLRRSCQSSSPLTKDLLSLPDTLLLFLQKLTKLTISMRLPSQNEQATVFTLSKSADRSTVHTQILPFGPTTHSSFLTISRSVTDMPSDAMRRNIRTADVVLAFPLDKDNLPLVKDQQVYAYLPVEKAGFKFLIQSDFITQANREGVPDTSWNDRLKKEICKAFIEMVEGFLSKQELKHRWVRWLTQNPLPNDFWRELQDDIRETLRQQRFLFAWDDAVSCTPAELLFVPEMFLDEDGEPLLPDVPLSYRHGQYLSRQYDTTNDLPILKHLGVRHLSHEGFLTRLEFDLNDQAASHVRAIPDENHEWHSRVADLLINILTSTNHSAAIKVRLRKLPIVPLIGGSWARPFNASIFFPDTGGIDIPRDLSLSLVEPTACANSSRRTLFQHLGVEICNVARVFPLIEQRERSGVPWHRHLDHLEFMYWHRDRLPLTKISMRLKPWDRSGEWFWCTGSLSMSRWSYANMEGSHEYTACSIFHGALPEALQGQTKMVNRVYYIRMTDWEQRGLDTPIDWFNSYFDLRSRLQLEDRTNSQQLSPELLYVAKEKPSYLLKSIMSKWPKYLESRAISEWDNVLKRTKVPVIGSNENWELERTYLPLPALKSIVARMDMQGAIGFVEELDGLSDAELATWAEFERFGVGTKADATFWLGLLRRARVQSNVSWETVHEIYLKLQTFTEPRDTHAIALVFNQTLTGYIRLPGNTSTWLTPKQCVWECHAWYTHKTRLSRHVEYRPLFGLFVNICEIADASLKDYLEYLAWISSAGEGEDPQHGENIERLYKEFADAAYLDEEERIRRVLDFFATCALVYYPPLKRWYNISECIWAEDTVQFFNKICLATKYRSHKRLFQDILKVAQPTLKMHIQSLKEKTTNQPQRIELIKEMQNVCAFKPTAKDLDDIRDLKCFPVKSPSAITRWKSSNSNFAIVDRSDYGKAFAHELDVLNFTLEEMHSVQILMEGLHLTDRFLSVTVQEQTSVREGTLSPRLTSEFRKKTSAICRYAAHLGSLTTKQDPKAAQTQLANTEVYTSAGISKMLSVVQRGRTITVDLEQACLHIDHGDILRIYLPKSHSRRELCFARELPMALLKELGVNKMTRAAELGHVLSISSNLVIEDLLIQAGIIDLPGLDPLSGDDDDSDDDIVSTVEDPSENASTSASIRRQGLLAPSTMSSSGRTTTANQYVESTPATTTAPSVRGSASPTSHETPSNTTSSPELVEDRVREELEASFAVYTPTPERQDQYGLLIDSLIKQAQHLAQLPAVNQQIRCDFQGSETINTAIAFNSMNMKDTLFKIGAAGELFVFELLRSLDLPDFTLENWRSRIRNRVSVHQNYQHLEAWPGRETTDIVYNDSEGSLVRKLIVLGYLGMSEWSTRRLKFHIEVKSTTLSLEQQFFCSQNQLDLMESMRWQAFSGSDEIYLIARVFYMGPSRTGLKLYLDPAQLRSDRKLIFSAEKYSVTPSSS